MPKRVKLSGNIMYFNIYAKLPSLNEYQDACRANKYKGAKMKSETDTIIGWFIRKAVREGTLLSLIHIWNSFIGAMMNAAQLGLEPNTTLGQAYLIPYGKQVQFVLGYKGLIDLAYRSGEVAIVRAETVFKNDEFVYELGFEPKLIHRPKLDGGRGCLLYTSRCV